MNLNAFLSNSLQIYVLKLGYIVFNLLLENPSYENASVLSVFRFPKCYEDVELGNK